MSENQLKITGAILAGGMARRMGGNDKGLIICANRPLIRFAIDALEPVVDEIVINANRNINTYEAFGHPVVSDQTDTFDGPLAGILSVMKFCNSEYLLTIPCDCPLLTVEALSRMVDAARKSDHECYVAHDGQRLQPVVCLLSTQLLPSLSNYLQSGMRKIDSWFIQHNLATVDYSDQVEIFRNVNTQDELAMLEQELDN